MLRGFTFFQVTTCLLVGGVHHASAESSSSSCMGDWLSAAGIPSSKIADYDAKLAAGDIQSGSLGHLNPILFRFLGITSREHQTLILSCAKSKSQNSCKNDGACSLSGGAYRCQCGNGFKGDRCEIDPCAPNPCVHKKSQSGTCTRNATSVAGFTCNCTLGYEGKQCHQMVNMCIPDPCLNGASCTGLLNDFHCSCGPHHHGKVCKHEWISRIDYERLKSGLAKTNQNMADFKRFMHLLFAGWKRRNSCIYEIFKERKTWHQAEKSCASYGGHLTSIHSREEEQFIINHVVKQTSRNLWIGGSDEANEGAWKWTDGSPVDFFNWDRDEPNGALHENCWELLHRPHPSRKNPWGWNDYPCPQTDHRLDAYLCKVCLKV